MKLDRAVGVGIVAGALALGGCGSEGSIQKVVGGAAGAGGGGGSGGSLGGGGGLGGSGGTTQTSPGTVTLKLVVSSTKSYCVQTDTCSYFDAITIKDSFGHVVQRWVGDCNYVDCQSCQQLACPGYACQPQGVAIDGETLTWDGSYFGPSTCGAGQVCTGKLYMPAGSYTAVMCATPGDLAPDSSNVMQCTNTGPQECVEVPFEFPSSQPYTGTLPG